MIFLKFPLQTGNLKKSAGLLDIVSAEFIVGDRRKIWPLFIWTPPDNFWELSGVLRLQLMQFIFPALAVTRYIQGPRISKDKKEGKQPVITIRQ